VIKTNDDGINALINGLMKNTSSVMKNSVLARREYSDGFPHMQGYALTFRVTSPGVSVSESNQLLLSLVKKLSAKSDLSKFETEPADGGGIIVDAVIVTDIDTKLVNEKINTFFKVDLVVSEFGPPRLKPEVFPSATAAEQFLVERAI